MRFSLWMRKCSCLRVMLWCLCGCFACGVWGLPRVSAFGVFLRRKLIGLMAKVGRRVFLADVRS